MQKQAFNLEFDQLMGLSDVELDKVHKVMSIFDVQQTLKNTEQMVALTAAQVERMAAENQRMQAVNAAEYERLIAETMRIRADFEKAQAERDRINKETRFYPVVALLASAAFIAFATSVTTAFGVWLLGFVTK